MHLIDDFKTGVRLGMVKSTLSLWCMKKFQDEPHKTLLTPKQKNENIKLSIYSINQ